ncbi:alpha/beta hydrolase fold protein [Natronomonas pharaonis DSM 2160]|uniref:Alpha/beta hydrolase fold protein n=1 Tax=Natronomonas pharaonis (strain ATCC 35678 / DSM 2160 / CIP 103997 / JCM 8858 / NBRC 14720 / NCIMB 2260 / Gabara) TaxID=348780 RepID=A0A1U7EWK7_NATPD|nr:alpha/beta fold hydrolase [Natronomonas pharaonis]CAI49448.1 alpha/beta hydrolase fold protein [Natronomonas pharaonis DSM 2160]
MAPKHLVRNAAVGLGAVVVGNRLLRCSPETLAPPLARTQQTYEWQHRDVAYTEAGDPDAPDLVLLHAPELPRSSHEFRYVIDALSETHHVFAPDLPGFGRSAQLPETYDAEGYSGFLQSFLSDMTEQPTVVAASVTAAYAVAAGTDANAATDIDEYVLICPTTTAPQTTRRLAPAYSLPVAGEAFRNVTMSKPMLRYRFGTDGFAEPSAMTAEWLRYSWQASHRQGGHRLLAARAAGRLDSDIDLGSVLSETATTTTLLWGREADSPPVAAGRRLATAADARLVVFENAATLPHAEHPEPFVELFDA